MNTLISRGFSNRRLLVALLAASIGLAACGGGGGDDNGSNQAVSNVVPAKPTGSGGATIAASTPSAASAPSSASVPATASAPQAASSPTAASTPAATTPASGPGTSGSDQTANNGGNLADNTRTNDPPPPVVNSVPITVDNTLDSTIVNAPYVSVKLCVPGSQGAAQCVTVDHMLLDTGSVGIRVLEPRTPKKCI
jgi:hypothetical protein